MRALLLLLLGLFAAGVLLARPAQGAKLRSNWRYHPRNSAAFAQPGYDDRGWVPVAPAADALPAPLRHPGSGWLRLHWRAGPGLAGRRLFWPINQAAATEVYLKGQLVQPPGRVRALISRPFFTTQPAGEGTGLGLSLAYNIAAEGYGGPLDVESTEAVGTAFTLRLPARPSSP